MVKHVILRVATSAADHIRNKFTETQNIPGASSRGWYRYGDLMYHKQVRWLNQEVVTQRCVNTDSEVLPFLESSKILFFRMALEITSYFSCKTLTTHQLEN